MTRLAERGQSLVRGQVRRRRPGQLQLRPGEVALVVRHGLSAQPAIGRGGSPIDLIPGRRLGWAAPVPRWGEPVVGSRGQQERDGVGACDTETVAFGSDRPALEHGPQTGHVAQARCSLGTIVKLARHHEAVLALGDSREALGTVQSDTKGQSPRLVAREPDDQHLSWCAGDDLSREPYAARPVRDPRHPTAQVELPAVPLDARLWGVDVEPQVTQGLVATERDSGATPRARARALAHQCGPRQVLGGALLAGHEQAPYLGQGLGRGGVVRILRAAGPHAVLVELDALVADPAEHHASKTAIADREGIDPGGIGRRLRVLASLAGSVGRAPVPQHQPFGRPRRLTDELPRALGRRARRSLICHHVACFRIGVHTPSPGGRWAQERRHGDQPHDNRGARRASPVLPHRAPPRPAIARRPPSRPREPSRAAPSVRRRGTAPSVAAGRQAPWPRTATSRPAP